MREVVLDASIVAKWFRDEDGRGAADAIRAAFVRGTLVLLAPSLLKLELLNTAARRWRWDEPSLVELADTLDDVGIAFIEPDLRSVAGWAAAGLTAYDAAYVATAECAGLALVTVDRQVLHVASHIAVSLDDFDPIA